jgi:hypothetical protein
LFLLIKYGSECALDLKILYDPLGQSFKLNGECQYGYIRFEKHLVSMNGKEEVSYPLYLKGGRGIMATYRCKIPATPEGVSVRTLLHLGSFFWECPHP